MNEQELTKLQTEARKEMDEELSHYLVITRENIDYNQLSDEEIHNQIKFFLEKAALASLAELPKSSLAYKECAKVSERYLRE